MSEYLLQLKTQAIELWQKMTKVQKIVIVGSVILLFGTLALLARGATKPDYSALFTQLDDQQAGEIVAKLKEMKISYQISGNGGTGGNGNTDATGVTSGGVTILVPSDEVAQTRLDLASNGLPTGGVVGFEDFNNTKFGETDTDRQVRYLNALQGELTRTIQGMAEVDKARVHIVLPEPSLYTDEQKNATAAVMLKLKPYKTLNDGQVKGLVKLVSNSVEGLKPENVTIVDMAGNVLSENIGTDDLSKAQNLSISQAEIQKQYQKEVQNSIQSMLERIVGVGKAVVRVQMELDFDKIQQKSQKYYDDKNQPKVIRSQQVTDESDSSTNNGTSGVPGTSSNIPGYTSTTSGNGSSQSTKTNKITNYEISSLEEVRDVAPGSVKRLSVAVVVGKGINAQEQKTIEDVVKSASGFDSQRGDQISVAGIPFNTEYEDQMKSDIANAEKQRQMLIYGGLALLALLIIGGVVANIIIKRRRAKALEEELLAEEAAIAQEEAEVEPLPVEKVEEIVNEEPQLSPEEIARIKLKEQVEKVATEHPDDVAQLLKTWLSEE